MKKKVLKLDGRDGDNRIIEEEIKDKDTGEDKKEFLKFLELSTGLGFSISVPIAGGALLGAYLDKMLGTGPKLTLSLLFTGVIIGAISIYRILKEK